MGNTLQDQLVKVGLVNEKQLEKANTSKQREKKKRGERDKASSPSTQAAARKTRAEKAAHDRALNDQRKTKAERKAMIAQIRQLIDENRLERGDEAEIGYYFQDGERVCKVYVTSAMQRQLGEGSLEIVRLDGRFDLVPSAVAHKIRARNPAFVVARRVANPEPAEGDPYEGDPYKDYPIPDDLMW